MACSRLLLYPILWPKFHRARHVANAHPPVKVASTSQGRIHQSRSHPPVKVTSTSQSRIHQSRSHPPVKVAPTSQGHTHKSRSHPPVEVTPTSQSHTHQSRSICNVACTVAIHSQVSLPCRAQYKQEPAICSSIPQTFTDILRCPQSIFGVSLFLLRAFMFDQFVEMLHLFSSPP